jgi:hypothetical protein
MSSINEDNNMDTGRGTVKRCLDQSPEEAHTAEPFRAPKLHHQLDEKASTALNSFNSNLLQAAAMYLAAYNRDDAPTSHA